MYLVLSKFDDIVGPSIFISLPSKIPDEMANKILNFMDVSGNETFFEYKIKLKDTWQFVNYLFQIDCPWSRGQQITLLITGVFERKFDLTVLEYRFKETVAKFLSFPDLYKGFFFQKQKDNTTETQKAIIESLMEDLYHVLAIKLSQLEIIDQLFAKRPLNEKSNSIYVYQDLISTFISTIDARTPEGAIILHNIGSRFARKLVNIFKGQDIEVLFQEISIYWRRHRLGIVEDVQINPQESRFKIRRCFECMNIPKAELTLCTFLEGLFTTIFQEKVSENLEVVEIDCIAKGSSHCVFIICNKIKK